MNHLLISMVTVLSLAACNTKNTEPSSNRTESGKAQKTEKLALGLPGGGAGQCKVPLKLIDILGITSSQCYIGIAFNCQDYINQFVQMCQQCGLTCKQLVIDCNGFGHSTGIIWLPEPGIWAIVDPQINFADPITIPGATNPLIDPVLPPDFLKGLCRELRLGMPEPDLCPLADPFGNASIHDPPLLDPWKDPRACSDNMHPAFCKSCCDDTFNNYKCYGGAGDEIWKGICKAHCDRKQGCKATPPNAKCSDALLNQGNCPPGKRPKLISCDQSKCFCDSSKEPWCPDLVYECVPYLQ